MRIERQSDTPDPFDVLLRVGGFAIVAFLVLIFTSANTLEEVTRSALAVFAAGLAANLLLASKFEQSRFADFGLGWPPRHFATGFALGLASLSACLLGALGTGLAEFHPAAIERSPAWLVLMLFVGVIGEEMFFRGYAFQFLLRAWNATGVIVGSGLLFGLMHLQNANATALGAANTALWGCLLGYAYTRSRNLWLPSGIHFGWNLALTLFTSNLSGSTIRATGWDLVWSGPELWTGGAYGLEGGLLATLAAVPVFLALRRVRCV